MPSPGIPRKLRYFWITPELRGKKLVLQLVGEACAEAESLGKSALSVRADLLSRPFASFFEDNGFTLTKGFWEKPVYGPSILLKIRRMIMQLLYQGHGSIRLTCQNGVVVYVDPYAGIGYDLPPPADLALITCMAITTHMAMDLLTRKPDFTLITYKEALQGGIHRHFSHKGLEIQAVTAQNKNHDPKECVGYVISGDGVRIYCAGDTSYTKDMETLLPSLKLDYALLPIDGVYNMGPEEASDCARKIKARVSIPIHMKPGQLFDRAMGPPF